MSKELWCIYLAGPDDLVAMPSKAVAEAVARNFNAVWDRYGAERGHDVRAVAHAEPWMHGKEAHSKDLREHFHEYADLVLHEDAARFKPAQPVEAARERDSVPPRWYTLPEIEHCLQRMSYSDAVISELAPWFFRHIKSAFDKGYSVAVERAALCQPRPTVTPEPRDADLHAGAPDEHHEIARAVWEHMNRRSAPGAIMTMAYTAVLRALASRAPTGEQAGEMAWYFVSIDDDGRPSVTYCPSPGAIELAVREWMGGDPDAECLSDDDEDMARGVRDDLLKYSVFRPEGDPPCYLLPAAVPEVQS